MKALNDISIIFRSKNPTKALEILKEAFEISDSIGCQEYTFCLNLFLNTSYTYQNLENYFESLKFAKMGVQFDIYPDKRRLALFDCKIRKSFPNLLYNKKRSKIRIISIH